MPNLLTGKLEDNGTSVVDVTNPRQPKYIAHIPGGGEAQGPGQAQMVRACSGLPKADRNKSFLLRTLGTTGHEVWDVTTPEKPTKVSTYRQRAEGHAQELVGVRHRHRVSRRRRSRVAHAAHDEDLRPQRSRAPGLHPRLRPARPAARRDHESGADRAARADLDRPKVESRLLRLRHGPLRRRPDRRSQEAARGAEGADRREPPVSGRSGSSICRSTRARTRRFR